LGQRKMRQKQIPKGIYLVAFALLLCGIVDADVTTSPNSMLQTVFFDNSYHYAVNVTNWDNATYTFNTALTGSSTSWYTLYPTILSIPPYSSRLVSFDIDVPAEGDADNKIYSSLMRIYNTTWEISVPISLNVTKENNGYYLIADAEDYDEDTHLTLQSTGWDVHVYQIYTSYMKVNISKIGKSPIRKTCYRNANCQLNKDVLLVVNEVSSHDYANFEVWTSNDADTILQQYSNAQYIVMSSQGFQKGDNFCVDSIQNRYAITSIGYSMVEITSSTGQFGTSSVKCYRNAQCNMGDMTISLDRIDGYSFSTGTGTAFLTITSPTNHFATNCGGSTGGTTNAIGDLTINIISGQVRPNGIIYLSILDTSYNPIRTGTVSVDANTLVPQAPQGITADGLVKIVMPPDMQCPVKITALTPAHSPTTIFPTCSDTGRTDVENYTTDTGQLVVKAIVTGQNSIVVGDSVTLSVESADGRVIPGAQLTIRDPSGIIINQPWTTDSKGQMQMTVTQNGVYKVTAVKAGYGSSTETPFTVGKKTMTPTYAPGQTVKIGDSVSIILKDSVKDTLIIMATVSPTKPPESDITLATKTDNAGQILFTPDVGGTYSFTVSTMEYDPITFTITAESKTMNVALTPPDNPPCGSSINWMVTDSKSGVNLDITARLDSQVVYSGYNLPILNKDYNLEITADNYAKFTKTLNVKCQATPPTVQESYGVKEKVTLASNAPLMNPQVTCSGSQLTLEDITDPKNVKQFSFTTPNNDANCTISADNLASTSSFTVGGGFKIPGLSGGTQTYLLLGLVAVIIWKSGILSSVTGKKSSGGLKYPTFGGGTSSIGPKSLE
jgi:hypothetical protein